MERLKRALQESHDWLEEVIREGDAVVDATMGNGHDTVFLAQLVGENGMVAAFDIQPDAVKRTRERLESVGLLNRCRLFSEGHETLGVHLDDLLPEKGMIRAVVFNLGWLPGGNHSLGTRADTTLMAAEQALVRLDPEGLLLMVVYYGGKSGFAERDAVMDWASSLDCRIWNVRRTDFPNQINCPPFLLCVEHARPPR